MKPNIIRALEEEVGSPAFMRALDLVGSEARFYGDGVMFAPTLDKILRGVPKISKEEYAAYLTEQEREILNEVIRHSSVQTPSYRIFAFGSSVHYSKLPTREEYSDIDLVFYCPHEQFPKKHIVPRLVFQIGEKRIETAIDYEPEIRILEASVAGELIKNFAPWLLLKYTSDGYDATKEGIRFFYCNGTFQISNKNLSLELQHPDYTKRLFHFSFTNSKSLVTGIFERSREAIRQRRQDYSEKYRLNKRQTRELFFPILVELYNPVEVKKLSEWNELFR